MITKRIDKVVILLALGFVFIVQTIVTGELGYVPTDILVKLGLGIGFSMVLGSGYALIVPATGMRNAFRASTSAPSGLPAAA
ncbi:MAG: hypothetical protein V1934_07100 [Methanobacteriota archaeon]